MASKAYFIGPYESGMETDKKPWMLPDAAFADMRNAYVWRGRLKKRIGSHSFTDPSVTAENQQLISRLRIQLGTTAAGTGNYTHGGVAIPGGTYAIGQMFSIGTTVFTVYQAAGAMLTTGAATGTFDTVTGLIDITGNAENPSTAIYYYPALPVMGLITYETVALNNEPVIAFDPVFAYQRLAGGWARLGTALWTGTDYNFFSAANYRGLTNDDYYFFVVNNNQPDQIKYWNGAAWTAVAPATRVAANYRLHSARIIVSFKDRLICLNTLEQVGAALPALNFAQRARWCQNGSPLAANAWYDNVPGKGGWIEAPTKQAIITARILKDRLIVYFERSTWELVYTGNQVLPFVWQTIDDNLGVESTFSSILLDNEVLGIGQTGIHSCDGLHVRRIDEKIPQEVFAIHNGNNGVERVAGIRDYISELAYWTFPQEGGNPTYPTRLLVYNYKNGAWSFFDDSITAFGYYQNVNDITWGECTELWGECTRTWGAGANQSLYRSVLAGNQEGFTFIMDNNISRNAPGLQITNVDILSNPGYIILTVINHNLTTDAPIQAVLIEHAQGMTNLNNRIYVVTATTATTITLVDDPTTPVIGTYIGKGVITRVSIIDVKTKRFNFYKDSLRTSISRVELDLDKTTNLAATGGLLYCKFLPSTSAMEIGQINGDAFQIDMYANALYPLESFQEQLVRRIYPFAEGDSIQLRFYTDPAPFTDGLYDALSPFTLNSMTFYASPTSTR